jgi:hypothetical protein
MGSRWRVTGSAILIVSGLVAVAGVAPALAQSRQYGPAGSAPYAGNLPERQRKEAARKAYRAAEDRYREGSFAAALALYQQADDLFPIPATKYKIGTCRDRLGQVVDAVAMYQVFLDASPDPGKLGDAIADARARISALKQTPGKVVIATDPPSPPRLAFSLDNGPAQTLPTETSMLPLQGATAPTQVSVLPSVTPGHHRLVASAQGYNPSAADIDVRFAETQNLRLVLTPAGLPPPPTPLVSSMAAPAPLLGTPLPPSPSSTKSDVPSFIAFGVAAAGVGIGTGFGIAALASKNDFNTHPTTANADTTDRNARISDIAFIAGATCAAAGVVLLFVDTGYGTASVGGEPFRAASPVKALVTPFVTATGGGASASLTF